MAEELPTIVTADGLYVATIDPRPVDVIKEGRRGVSPRWPVASRQRSKGRPLPRSTLANSPMAENGPEITP